MSSKKNKHLETEMQINTNRNNLFASGESLQTDNSSSSNNVLQIGRQYLTPELESKIEDYDNMSLQNTRLIAENDDLTSKLAQYIEELDLLKTSQNDNFNVNETINSDYERLKEENSSLKLENDRYILKIAQLTFEIADLRSKLQSESTSIKNTIPTYPRNETRLEHPKANPYRYNGYNSWN